MGLNSLQHTGQSIRWHESNSEYDSATDPQGSGRSQGHAVKSSASALASQEPIIDSWLLALYTTPGACERSEGASNSAS